MLISKLKGGLGNQLFIYCYTYTLAKKNSIEFCFDTEEYKLGLGKELTINKFNIDFKTCNKKSLNKYKYRSKFAIEKKIKRFLRLPEYKKEIYEEKDVLKLNRINLNVKKDCYIDGYWQNIKYFLDNNKELKKKFSVQEKYLSATYYKLLEEINKPDSICMHIRKGDYLNQKNSLIYCQITKEYYELAIKNLKKYINKPKILIFTDDEKWVKQNLSFENTIYINEFRLSTVEEFSLLSKAKNIVISNSTYSLWSSILNSDIDKKIISPKNWFIKENFLKTSKLFTKDMVVLEN